MLCALALGLALLLLRAYAGNGASAPPRSAEPGLALALRAPSGSLAPREARREATGAARGSRAAPLAGSAPEASIAPHATIDREPRLEREHYERFLARLRAGEAERAALESDAARLLRSSASTAEQVALLRAFEDAGSRLSDSLHLLALRELPRGSDAQADSVPAYVVRRLGERAARDPVAWSALRGALHAGELDPASRGRVLALLVETASNANLSLVEAEIAASEDGLAREMGAAALRTRSESRDGTMEHEPPSE